MSVLSDQGESTVSDETEQGVAGEDEISIENYDADTSEQLLLERVFDGAFEALISLNEVNSRGELTEPYLGCVDSTGAVPLIQYDCSGSSTPATLQEFGFPVSELQLMDDPFCREQLVSEQNSLGCVIETLHVQFSDNWQFRSQFGELGDMVRLQVQLFQSDSSELADLASFSTLCELTLDSEQPTVRNDEDLCRQATQELLAQTAAL